MYLVSYYGETLCTLPILPVENDCSRHFMRLWGRWYWKPLNSMEDWRCRRAVGKAIGTKARKFHHPSIPKRTINNLLDWESFLMSGWRREVHHSYSGRSKKRRHMLLSLASVNVLINPILSPGLSLSRAKVLLIHRRKFRSQTSDNMDRWKSRGGKSQRREEKKEDQKRERVKSEDRRCRCAKRWQSRETLCFSHDLWLRRVEK